MKQKSMTDWRALGAIVALCALVLALACLARPAQAVELKAGDYKVGATLMKASAPTEESMAKDALVSPITVSVSKTGDYTATVTMQGLTVTMGGRTMTSYMTSLNYWNGTAYAPATTKSTQDYQGAAYPKEITFPLVNKMKGDDETGFVKIQTVTPGPSGAQAAYLKINWSELDKYLVSEKAAATMTSAGVTYAVSGKNATVTSISKKAKSATVKSTVKIGDKSYKVTSIKAKSAYNAKGLKKVALGKNLKTIGKNAFKGVSKTVTFTAPKSKLSSYKKLVKKAGAPSSAKYKAA